MTPNQLKENLPKYANRPLPSELVDQWVGQATQNILGDMRGKVYKNYAARPDEEMPGSRTMQIAAAMVLVRQWEQDLEQVASWSSQYAQALSQWRRWYAQEVTNEGSERAPRMISEGRSSGGFTDQGVPLRGGI